MKVDAVSLQLEIVNIRKDADALLFELSETQFHWRPAPNVWAISHCLDHLSLFARGYFPVISRHISRSKLTNPAGPISYSLGMKDRMIVRLIEPPVRMKVSAPKEFQPPLEKSLPEILRDFHMAQEALVQLIRQAESLPWDQIKVPSPQSARVKFQLATIFAVITAHERRHLWQAWRIRQHAKFPAA